MEKLLATAAKYRITMGVKCRMFQQSLKPYLGYDVSSQGISISRSRIQELEELAIPSDAKGVEKYIGMVNFSAPFLGTRVAAVLAPLTTLLRHDSRFEMKEEHINAIQEIKKLMIK